MFSELMKSQDGREGSTFLSAAKGGDLLQTELFYGALRGDDRPV